MITDPITFIFLLFGLIMVVSLTLLIKKKVQKSQLRTDFFCILCCLAIIFVGLILQILLSNRLSIDPIYFDYFVYIGTCFLPVAVFFMGFIFTKTKIQFQKWYLLLFVIPITSLLLLWTNNFHHLFYVVYSINVADATFGSYFPIHNYYTLTLDFIGIFLLIIYSIKNSGIFSKQAISFIIAAILPISVNILAYLNILPVTIYLTPIFFTFAIVICGFAIFKFKFLSITPIALQRIVDRISDSYIVLNEDNVITDFNQTFIDTFQLNPTDIRNMNLFDLLAKREESLIDERILKDALERVKISPKTLTFDKHFKSFGKYFHVEINTIISKGNFLGTLILLKDTTQHEEDMQTIQDNQDMLVERERFASLRSNDWGNRT